ncbi:MAG: hypothetical protein WDO73_17950 [Ignavibacteriota bacterium]
MDATQVVLSAGSLNSTEILLRSEAQGLSVSPVLGTRFSGNGDFFGLAYKLRLRDGCAWLLPAQDAIRHRLTRARTEYRGAGPLYRRISGIAAHLDRGPSSFPSAYIGGAKALFRPASRAGYRVGQSGRADGPLLRDLDPTAPEQHPRWAP